VAVTQEQIDQFHRFASERVGRRGGVASLEELIDLWRIENPSPDQAREDLLAVKAAVRDMENGERGQPWDEFARQFRARHGLAEST